MVPINRKQERGVRKRQTTTRHAMTSMCVGATLCPLVPRICLRSPCRFGPNPPARLDPQIHKAVSPGRFSASYKVTTPSKQPGLNKRPFYDFPSKSNWKFKAHTERERVDGKFRIIWREEERKKERQREHGKGRQASKGIQYHSWKAFSNLPPALTSTESSAWGYHLHDVTQHLNVHIYTDPLYANIFLKILFTSRLIK